MEKNYLEDLDVNVKIILERILRKYGEKVWIECIGLRTGTNGGLL
jgi:hypothetical protein